MATYDDPRHELFLRLFTAHEPALRTFVRSLVPLVADANDVMQEVAVVLWQKFGEYESSEDFRRWAFGVARFKVLAWQRDRMRDRHLFRSRTDRIAGDRRGDRGQPFGTATRGIAALSGEATSRSAPIGRRGLRARQPHR